MAKSEKFSKSEPTKSDKSDKTEQADTGSDETPTAKEGELGGEYADGEAPDYGFTSGQHDDSAATITLPEADPAQDEDAGFQFGSGEEPESDATAGEPVDGDVHIEDDIAEEDIITDEFAEEDVVTDEFAEEDAADEVWFPELADATVSGFDTSHLQPIDGSSGSLSDSIVDDVIFEG